MSARILIVEDNAANLKLMVYLLEAFGHATLCARDGCEALEIVRREKLDLVICDIQLPKMDGFEVARQLNKEHAFDRPPLVAVTALAMMGDRDKILAAGFDGYLAKPIVPQSFVKQIEAFLTKEVKVGHSRCEPNPPGHDANSSRATILVVDNCQANINLSRTILEPVGFRIVSASSASDALCVARKSPPDLILSDLHMPGCGGFDFISEIKSDRQLREIPFIFISNTYLTEMDCNRGLQLGASRFLIRPVEPLALVHEIRSCLSQPTGCQ